MKGTSVALFEDGAFTGTAKQILPTGELEVYRHSDKTLLTLSFAEVSVRPNVNQNHAKKAVLIYTDTGTSASAVAMARATLCDLLCPRKFTVRLVDAEELLCKTKQWEREAIG